MLRGFDLRYANDIRRYLAHAIPGSGTHARRSLRCGAGTQEIN